MLKTRPKPPQCSGSSQALIFARRTADPPQLTPHFFSPSPIRSDFCPAVLQSGNALVAQAQTTAPKAMQRRGCWAAAGGAVFTAARSHRHGPLDSAPVRNRQRSTLHRRRAGLAIECRCGRVVGGAGVAGSDGVAADSAGRALVVKGKTFSLLAF